ncbi:MAG: S49 family peptidase, partial [Candidatus Cloacimonadaceae bacterium]|nr:S49 family peptidase [Candidatus Cloacimonadaceae bacterium]
MPSSKKYLIGCLIFPLLVALAFFIGYRSVSKSMPATKIIPDGSWLVISPTGIIPEYSEIRQTNIFNLSTDSVEEICAKILAAKEDRKIKGLILRPRFAQISYAGISELGDAITDFKSSGKRVIAFGDMIGQRDYMISTLADEIYMEPSASAGIMLEGVNASITFYKEMFDKLGIKMHVLQTGDFKGFGEPFSQTSLSPGTLENYKKALGKRYDLIISFIANNRNLANAAVKSIFEERPDYFLSSQQALDAKLVDGLVGREKLFSTLGISEKQMISLSGYQSSYATPGKKDKIAVVYLEG